MIKNANSLTSIATRKSHCLSRVELLGVAVYLTGIATDEHRHWLNMAPSLHFLRPYAFQPLAPGSSPYASTYLRFYELARRSSQAVCQRYSSNASFQTIKTIKTIRSSNPVVKRDVDTYNPEDRGALTAARVKQLQKAHALLYPRLKRYAKPLTISNFRNQYEGKMISPSETLSDIVTVSGMLVFSSNSSLHEANLPRSRVLGQSTRPKAGLHQTRRGWQNGPGRREYQQAGRWHGDEVFRRTAQVGKTRRPYLLVVPRHDPHNPTRVAGIG
jgi:hypothetical protein